jgi:hypothetical protein
MKLETIFHPRFTHKDNVLIYHYCDKYVFESICQHQELWLSDIYTMNDSTEFNYGRDLFTRVLIDNKNEFDQQFRWYMIFTVMGTSEHTLPLIVCFSKKGDLLSQWRAYADDGRGFSIGFNSNAIFHNLGVNINSVSYKESEQYKLVLDTLRGLFAWWKEEGEDFSQISEPSMRFAIDLAYLKNSTFFEEQEVRIIRLMTRNGKNLYDPGRNSKAGKIAPLDVLSRARGGQDIKYVKLPINIKSQYIIKEVIVGPKNEVTINQIEQQLLDLDLKGILVKKSKSPYR